MALLGANVEGFFAATIFGAVVVAVAVVGAVVGAVVCVLGAGAKELGFDAVLKNGVDFVDVDVDVDRDELNELGLYENDEDEDLDELNDDLEDDELGADSDIDTSSMIAAIIYFVMNFITNSHFLRLLFWYCRTKCLPASCADLLTTNRWGMLPTSRCSTRL